MQYLSPKEYAQLKGITRQAVEDRMKRGTLPYVLRDVKRKEKRIPVEDMELEGVK